MSETPGDRPTGDRSRTGKPAWLPLGAAALIVPTALAGITLAFPRPQIEGDLTQRATAALSAAGIPGADVSFSGRDATIGGVPESLRDTAVTAVQDATGVRVADIAGPGGPAGPPAPGGPAGPPAPGGPAAAAAPFGLRDTGGTLVLTGEVGSDEERARLVAAAQSGGRTVDDQLTVRPGARVPDGLTPAAVTALGAAIAGSGAAASVTADGITLTGSVADQATKDQVGQAASAALPGIAVDNQLTVSGPAAGGELDAAAKQALQTQLDQLLAASPISFGPNSPQLTPAGGATVARVLELLSAAPGARVQIDGYVAAGPGDGRLTAQQLSDARAATVRDALVAGGVPADTITARGLGEGATPDRTAAARRVEITVV